MAKLVTLGVVLTMAALAVVVYLALDRPVVRVAVQGQLDPAEQAQIREAVLGGLTGGLLSADLDALRSGILALDWPRAVAIRRTWPDTLTLEVEKPTVVAIWQDAYLASDGRIVRLPGRRDDLPRFDCATAEPRLAMEIYHRLSESGSGLGFSIEQLTENALGEWGLAFRAADAQGRVTVMLGAESVQERFERFLIVYRQQLAGRHQEIAQVDARYDNGVAVSWLPSSPDAALVAAREAAAFESI